MQEKKKEDMLFLLVKSLNKSEKRFFTLHSQLASHSKTPNYVRLFNLLEGMEEYNQEYVLKELGKFAPAKHFNQIKRYLKVHLLSALKQYDKKNRHIKQLDQLTYVQVFLAKGLSKNAEKALQSQKKAFLEKEQCIYAHFINLQLTQLTSSREQLEDYYKNSIELLDIKTEMIELGIVKIQIQLIRYDKERLIKETRLDLENILQEMLVKFNYRQLKSIYSKALYLDSLFNLYMILENHDQALKVANEEYILLKTGYLSEQIANQCVNRINTLVLYKKTNNFTNYQSVLNQLYTLLDKHPYYKKQYIYWYYLRVIEYSLEQQTQLLPSNFTLQLLKDIEDPELNMSDTNKNGLYYHLAKYYFTNDEIQNTQNTLLKLLQTMASLLMIIII